MEGSRCDCRRLPANGGAQVARATPISTVRKRAFVLTVGAGDACVHADRSSCGTFHLTSQKTCPRARIAEFAINASNHRTGTSRIRIYVDDWPEGHRGPRGPTSICGWIAPCPEAHRVLSRGGIYLYPATLETATAGSPCALIYEAIPIAWLIEQAGGAASTGHRRILDVQPRSLHQRIPLLFGSREEVARLDRYHLEPHPIGERSPLFGRPWPVSELICPLPTRSFPSPAPRERARLQCDALSRRSFIAKISMPPISRAMPSTATIGRR